MRGGIRNGLLIACACMLLLASCARPVQPGAVSAYIPAHGQHRAALDAHTAARLARADRYPVPVTGMLLPATWIARHFSKSGLPARLKNRLVFGPDTPRTVEDFHAWLGLPLLAPGSTRKAGATDPALTGRAMGAATLATPMGEALTFGCAACHSQNFFGTLVMGMGNKHPRANRLFWAAKRHFQDAPLASLGPEGPQETAMLERTRTRLRAIGVQLPAALGLDTSLAQVSLSLARRAPDPVASFSQHYQRQPRPDHFDHAMADSKPLDWWAVKYKRRWLADGAMTSGNVVVTNILWNELGRGTDLVELDRWLAANRAAVSALHRQVISSAPPEIEDFMPGAIDIGAARRGERHFNANCAGCHGRYRKDWTRGPHTLRLDYPARARPRDVGTDLNRAAGMTALAPRLNALFIARRNGLKFEATGGYMSPPLVGIWSRYPYLHNRSVPNLCELFKPASQRTKRYYVGTTIDIGTDFDNTCIGYPLTNIPVHWRRPHRLFDTAVEGLSNQGHEMFVAAPDTHKRDLIEFLKTL